MKKNIIVLAYIDDLLVAGTTRDVTSFLAQLQESVSLKHSTHNTTQQLLPLLGKCICRHPNGDITISLERSCYYGVLKHTNLDNSSNPTSTPSLWRPPATRVTSGPWQTSRIPQSCQHAHLGSTGTSRPPVYSKRPHSTSFNSNRVGVATSQAHAQYLTRTMHYKLLISPRYLLGN